MQHSEHIGELAAALSAAQNAHEESAAMIRFTSPQKVRHRAEFHARFFSKVIFGMHDCWYWIGSLNRLGYGAFPALNETKAHRVSWKLFNGEIPGGLFVLHKCDVRNCVNPEHLFLGTQRENIIDMDAKGRRITARQHGEANPMAKLTRDTVLAMRNDKTETGISYASIAKKYGVSTMTAYRAISGQSWSSINV